MYQKPISGKKKSSAVCNDTFKSDSFQKKCYIIMPIKEGIGSDDDIFDNVSDNLTTLFHD